MKKKNRNKFKFKLGKPFDKIRKQNLVVLHLVNLLFKLNSNMTLFYVKTHK